MVELGPLTPATEIKMDFDPSKSAISVKSSRQPVHSLHTSQIPVKLGGDKIERAPDCDIAMPLMPRVDPIQAIMEVVSPGLRWP